MTIQIIGQTKIVQDPLRDIDVIIGTIHFFNQDDKLVTPHTRDQIFTAHTGSQTASAFNQQ